MQILNYFQTQEYRELHPRPRTELSEFEGLLKDLPCEEDASFSEVLKCKFKKFISHLRFAGRKNVTLADSFI